MGRLAGLRRIAVLLEAARRRSPRVEREFRKNSSIYGSKAPCIGMGSALLEGPQTDPGGGPTPPGRKVLDTAAFSSHNRSAGVCIQDSAPRACVRHLYRLAWCQRTVPEFCPHSNTVIQEGGFRVCADVEEPHLRSWNCWW